jgi:hypothetical protein
MQPRPITIPLLALIGATRGMLGLGAGLLLAPRLGRDHCKTVGGVLLAIGVLSTIPLALRVFGRSRRSTAGAAAMAH